MIGLFRRKTKPEPGTEAIVQAALEELRALDDQQQDFFRLISGTASFEKINAAAQKRDLRRQAALDKIGGGLVACSRAISTGALRDEEGDPRDLEDPLRVVFEFPGGMGKAKAWIGRLTGRDAKFGYSRDFLPRREARDQGGRVVAVGYLIDQSGIFQFKDGKGGGGYIAFRRGGQVEGRVLFFGSAPSRLDLLQGGWSVKEVALKASFLD